MTTNAMNRARNNTEYRATCAYWYAVGYADGTGDDDDRAEEFRQYHRAQAEAYYGERATSLPSIPDAFRAFVAGR